MICRFPLPCKIALLTLWAGSLAPALAARDDVPAAPSVSAEAALLDAGDHARFAAAFAKGRRGEPITVGFIGGSITEGYFSTNPSNRYADRVTAWFRSTFPKSQITEVDAGIGGTGSAYGCLRARRDLLSKKPDAVIVEFAVNDDDSERVASTLEGVVRQVLAEPQRPACLLLFMSHAGQNAQEWHAKVGRHYGLSMVSYRDGLANEIKAGRLKWEDVMHDDIHPNDRGHALAAAYVTAMLDRMAGTSAATPAAATLPAPLYTDLYQHVDLRDAAALKPTKADGFVYDAATQSWHADKPGSVIEFAVQGRGVNLSYYRIHKNFGQAKVTVDGGHPQTVDGWFDQTWGGYRQTADIATDLPPGDHTLRVEVLAEKATQSGGHEFRILGVAGLGVDPAPAKAEEPPYVWHDVPVGGGGYISGVYAHPTAPGLMYAKTDIGGAYRRDSADSPWVPITDWIDGPNWNYSGMESLALDPNDPDAVFIAGGSYVNAWGGAGAFLRSFDRGRTWAVSKVSFKMGGNEDGRSQGERLAVDPNDGRVLLFGSRRDGLWRSEDRGATWSAVAGFPLPPDAKKFGIPLIVFDAASGTKGAPTPVIIAGCDSPTTPLLHSTDAGKTWTPVPNAPRGLLPFRAGFGDGGALFVTFGNAVGPNEITGGAVYRCDPAKGVWTDISPAPANGPEKFGYSGLYVDPNDPRTMLVSTLDRWAKGDDVFRSHDGGKIWVGLRANSERDASAAPWIKFGHPQADFGHWTTSVVIDPQNSDHILYVTGWGMWESKDATAADHGGRTHWVFAGTGIDEGVMNEVLSPPAGPAHVLSILWDIDGFRHEDVNRSPPDGFFKQWAGRDTSIDFAEADPNFVVRVFGGQILGRAEDAQKGGAFSTDNGATWTLFPGKPAGAIDGTVAAAADGGALIWTPENQGTVVSRDRAVSWTPADGLPWNLRVLSDRVDPKRFYAVDGSSGVLYASADGGATFTAKAKTLPIGDVSLRPQPAHAGRLWLATSGGVLRSDDGGATFAPVAGLDSASRLGFGLAPAGGPAVFAIGRVGGRYGLYRSDDDGNAWTRINDDQHGFMELSSITGDPRVPGRVYVSSRSRGILRGDPPAKP